MRHLEVHPPHVRALAEKLLRDINQRGLGVGDRYLTTDVVSRMLGVRKAVAGKAMRHLAERHVLITKPRGGTFIGPGLEQQPRQISKVRTVFILLPAGDPGGTHWACQPFVAGIRRAISDVNVQFTFVPEHDPLPYLRDLVDGARAAGQLAGIVAVSCSPEVYRYLVEQRLPAVVHGTLYSSDLLIASVDIDGRQSGRLLTEYLVSRGHRRMAVLTTSAGWAGDNYFLDGIGEAFDAAGLPFSALIQRAVRSDLKAFRAIAKELLQRTDRPTAIMTRGGMVQVAALASVASNLGLVVPDDVEIVFDHENQISERAEDAFPAIASYSRAQPSMSFEEIAMMIGNMLTEIGHQLPLSPKHVVIPVELYNGKQG